jgi:peptidoglycan/LPS O-acetylase OafA/YrhL
MAAESDGGQQVVARRAGTPSSTRFAYIDALRGLAALCVACYHITRYGPLPEPASRAIPQALMAWFEHGWMGVQVFFVISGFVIAYSVRDALVTTRYVGNYALRRSIRLDPPYWTTMAFVLGVHYLFSAGMGFVSPLDVPTPMRDPLSWKLLGSHVLYVQNILGYENLSAGFWTLCIEVQFYLLYVIGQGAAQRFWRKNSALQSAAPAAGLLMVFGPLALASLWYFSRHARFDMWVIKFFCMFFLGCLCWWVLNGQVRAAWLWCYLVLVCGRLAVEWSLELCVAALAGVSIYALGQRGLLETALNLRWLQHLGRISYSLYLIHFPVSHLVTTVAAQWVGNNPAPAVAAGVLLVALAASLGAAHVLYTCVEAPSVRLAARFKRAAPNPESLPAGLSAA